MGMGDDIMATVQARALYEATGHRVRPRDYWSVVWDKNPCFETDGRPHIEFYNVPGNRPYILGQTADRFIWNPNFRAKPGELYVDAGSLNGVWVIEPNVKGTVSANNKDWGFHKWQAVVDNLDMQFVQLGMGPWLEGVERVHTASFKAAISELKSAAGFVGTDGGLHHAAAAFGLPAVVVWGGFVSPEMLGYSGHINLWSGTESCGSKAECGHCREAMEAISIQEVCQACANAR